MLRQIFAWTFWLFLLLCGLNFAPLLLRMNRDQLATVGVFTLAAVCCMFLARLFHQANRPGGGEDEGRRLLEHQNRNVLNSYRSHESDW